MSRNESDDYLVAHRGGCHCGAVTFNVRAPAHLRASQCNCSICAMTDDLHLTVPASQFNLISGAGDLTTYTFNTGTARHLFCTICGIKSFYIPRSHPDGYSVNVRCLDPKTIDGMNVRSFDGQHWEDTMTQCLGQSSGDNK